MSNHQSPAKSHEADGANGAFAAALMESSGDAIISVDRNAKIIAWNPAAQRLFGFSSEEAIGRPIADVLASPSVRPQLIDMLKKAMRGEEPLQYETLRHTRDGSLVDVSVTVFPVRDQAGYLVGASAIYRDVTKTRLIQAELRTRLEQEQALVEFARLALRADDLIALLEEAVALVVRTLKVDYCEVLELQPGSTKLLMRAGSGWKPGLVGRATMNTGVDSQAGYTLLSKDPVVVKDLRTETRFRGSQLLIDHEVVSGLSTIIGNADRPYGVLAVHTRSRRDFLEYDVHFLRALAGSIGQVAERLDTRQALRRSEAYFHSLIDNSFDVIVVLDAEGKIRFDNASMRRIFGYEEGEVLGKICFDFVHPQELETARQSVTAAMRTGSSRLDCRLRRKDGAWLDCVVVLSRIADPEGRSSVVVNIHDVSARKQAEQARAFLASIVESSSVAIVGVTCEGKIASWNRAAGEIYGYTAQEIVGQPRSLLSPEGDAIGAQLLARATRGEHPGLHEVRRRRKNGEIISLSVSYSPIFDAAGTVVGVASFERSPTEETRLEQELQRARSYTRNLIESSLDAMLTVDRDLIVTDLNEQTVRLVGTNRDAIIGTRFDAYFTDGERAAQGIARTLKDGSVSNYDLVLKSATGGEIEVSSNASVFRDEAGQPRGVLVVARDVTHQKQMEQDLRETQAYTRGLIESVDPMVMIDNESIIRDVNQRMATMVEMPRTMLVGNRFDPLFTDPDRAAAAIARAVNEGAITNCDLTMRTLSGREIPVSLNASIFYDAAGQPQGALGVVRDVTEQRRLDRQLREQQSYSRSLFESSVDALLAVDLRMVITDINEQTLTLTGYTRPELIGNSFPMLFTDPERAAGGLRHALAEGPVKDYELTLHTAGGEESLVSFNISPFKDAEGKVLGILASARDISERRRLEGERSLLASIVTSSADAIVSYSPDTTVTSWNAGANRLFGYSAAEMIGRSITVCAPLERRKELLEHLNLVLAGKGVQQFESQRRRKDGSLVEVLVTDSPIVDQQGKVIAISTIYHDIIERKLYELELTRARDEALEGARERSKFLANMSHEIRTPLTSITGMVDMLLDTASSDLQRRRLLSVRENSYGLLAILNEILDFSKLSAGKITFQTVDFDLEEILHAVLNPFADAARRKGLEVIAAIEPDVPRLLHGDPDRLGQVLRNLFSNAVKFTEHGEIAVKISKLSESPADTTLRFEVRDTGIGIPAKAQTRLFVAFSQVEGTALNYGGAGLGLAIVKQLVEAMEGVVGVTSTPGAGSTFWFTARLSRQSASREQPHRAPRNLEGIRALLVDDNRSSREAVVAQLRSWKMVPDAVAGPREGLENMRSQAQQRQRYAIALLDMEMPEMTGIELARQVRQTPEIADTPLVILSSAATTSDASHQQLSELGVKSLLIKPVKESQLRDCLAATLGGVGPDPAQSPEAAEQSQAPAPAPISGPQGTPLRVLVAEDNATNREVALWQLRKLGCLADTVADGREALEAATKKNYDVVLMDCRMPAMDGYEATRRLRQHEGASRHTKVIALTAHALIGDRERCLDAGMDDYLSKPVTLETLAAALGRVLSAGAEVAPATAASSGDGSKPAESPVVDPATMASLRAAPGLLPGLIDTALGEISERLKQLAETLAAGKHADAAIAAHALKGTAKVFGAERMAEAAKRVEQAADEKATAKAEAELENLRAECQHLCEELKVEGNNQPSK